jgi:Flp pilus assembly protein TadD
VWRRRSDRPVMMALAWMWIWLVPFSQLVTPVHILVADRYAFLLTAGGCLLAALALDRLQGIVRTAAMALLVGVLALCTIRAEGPWASSRDLFTAAIASNPRDWKNYQDLAVSLSSEGEPELALRAVEAGLVVLPDDMHLRLQRSDLLWQLGDKDAALEAARQAAETGSKAAASGYAKRLLDSGRPDEALPWAEGAARAHPDNERYQQTLAEVCVTLGRWSCAEQALRAAVAIPDHQPSDDVLLERVRAHITAAPSATTPSTAPAIDHQGR